MGVLEEDELAFRILWRDDAPTMEAVTFHQAESPEDKARAGALIRQYLEWLQTEAEERYGLHFDVEGMVASDLADSGKFRPPDGRLYLVRYEGEVVGVGALKKLEEGVAEIQRMFVPPEFRGKGLGRAIVERLVEDARMVGYRQIKLESLSFLHAAHALYRSMGFEDVEPYGKNSMESFQARDQLEHYFESTVFMNLAL